MNILILFLCFYIYSILGWCTEMVYCMICQGKIINRGFLIGPYCPIYGFGGVAVILLLAPYSYNPYLVFILSLLIATVIEYITSYIMEKLFNLKLWDYSQFKFHLNGRICLLNAIEFGVLGLVATYFLHPYIALLILFIPNNILPFIAGLLFLVLIVDISITLANIFDLKAKLKYIKELADKFRDSGLKSDFEIFKQLEDVRKNIVQRSNSLKKRFINAFPNLEFIKLNDQFKEFKLELNQKKHELMIIRRNRSGKQ